ncbi:MAG: flagellin lysine-N-methylase, partial [Oscillospiraceae bacterium]|nr:flagellin lysine-N-methylase [Oscillospiraceae bacterium]
MILRMPEYYKNFTCTADRCSDNCCIGWEIDIDSNTAAYYDSVTDDFGTKLRKNISKTNPKSFILSENERCPFLNDRNLCEIILTLGGDKLCNICTEHPRYYEWFGN